MGIARSTYYGAPPADRDAEILTRIEAICAEFEAYGYRRVTAELRHQGHVVNSKKVRRLMREHDLQPKQRRRYVATTDSDHDEPIFPNLAADMAPDGPNQLWVADITYVAIATGFVYLAVILDAWSRRVVGYAISRSIDARLTIAALTAAIRSRAPPQAACITATAARKADSTGRRNASLNGSEHGVEGLGRRLPPERLARSAVEGRGHCREVVRAVRAQVGPLREVLAQQPVGVLVRPALPRAVRVAEVDLQARVDPQPRVLRHLRPLVPGQRAPQLLRQGGDRARDGVAHRLGAVPGERWPVLLARPRRRGPPSAAGAAAS